MSFTRNTVARGAGAVVIRRLSDDRLLYLNTNSKYTFSRSLTQGNKVQGFNSDGTLLDLDVAGAEETYELEIVSKKNTRNINELMLNSTYTNKSSFDTPWAESALISGGTVTLKGGSPVSGTLVVSYLDGNKLTLTVSAPSAAGQFKDNGDGTITFNTADNGKTIVAFYKTTMSNVNIQGGADNTSLGYVDVMFHQVSGASSVTGKKGVDIIWLPKCALLSDASFEFSNDVADKSFKLTGLIPDLPVGFKVPYVIIRDVEIDNTNAG